MRWIIRLLSGLVMLVLLAVGALFLIPGEEVAGRAADQITAITGRAVMIAAPVEISLWPRLAVATGPVTLANADWAGDAPMVTAQGLRIAIDTAALLRGRVEIGGLELQSPEIRLQRQADGRANWDLLPASGAAAGAGDAGSTGGTPAVTLGQARVQDGRVILDDAMTGQRHDLAGIAATIRLPDPNGELQLELTGQLNGQGVQIDMQAGPALAMLGGAAGSGQMTARVGGAGLTFTGRLGLVPLLVDGRVDLDAGDRVALGRAAGFALPDLPPGLGARVVQATGQVALAGDNLTLRDLALTLDDNRLQGDLAVALAGARPKVTGTVTATRPFVLPASGGGSSGGTGGASDGWSTAPINLGGLHAVDADLAFSLPGAQAGGATIGTTRGHVALDAGRAVVTLAELAAYDGRITGTVVANARGNGSVRADLVLADLALGPLLREVAGYDRLIATANGEVALLSSAASMAAMMQQLEGSGRLTLGRGELRGLDIAGMLRHLDPGYVGEGQKTIFDSVSGSFAIAGGVLRADDLRLTAPLVTVDGSGTVDLGARALNYRLLPAALVREDGSGGVKVPLLITGPWAKPRFRLDVEALAKPKIDAERARAEQRLKDEVARKAEEKLHIRAEEGERLEDAAKRKLERELQRGLGRLLGGN